MCYALRAFVLEPMAIKEEERKRKNRDCLFSRAQSRNPYRKISKEQTVKQSLGGTSSFEIVLKIHLLWQNRSEKIEVGGTDEKPSLRSSFFFSFFPLQAHFLFARFGGTETRKRGKGPRAWQWLQIPSHCKQVYVLLELSRSSVDRGLTLTF